MNADFARTKACVDHFIKLGLCPLPSRMDIKGPLLPSYAEHYEGKPVPRWVYEKWATTNTQVITGTKSPTPTKIIVVDLDGPEAVEAWGRITEHHGWTPGKGWVSTTGSGGRHHWFLLPDGVNECPSGIIWGLWDTWGRNDRKPGNGDWCKHKEVRILADNALVVSPPSIHVGTGNRYQFDDDASPRVYRLPEVAPSWLLAMPRLSSPRFGEPPAPRTPVAYHRKSDKFYTREEVIHAVADKKFEIATREWGLVSPVDRAEPERLVPVLHAGPRRPPILAAFRLLPLPGRNPARPQRPVVHFVLRSGRRARGLQDLAGVPGLPWRPLHRQANRRARI